jgi:hypothetical protein
MKKLSLVLISITAWLAVALQIFVSLTRYNLDHSHLFRLVDTLSYFTVTTNTLVAIVATCSLFQRSGAFLTRAGPATAVAVYIFVVAVVYHILLRSLWNPTGLQLIADIALHTVVPALYPLNWVAFVPRGVLLSTQPAWWLIYPVIYIGWTLLRGAFIGLYPYPFADAATLGYPRAIFNAVLFLIGFYLLGLLAVALDRGIARVIPRAVSPASSGIAG